VNLQSAQISALALSNRLPTMFANRLLMDAGGLMAYSTDFAAPYRRAATYVDKILKGAQPGELPIEEPTKFDLLLNMKTAKALASRSGPRYRGGRTRSFSRSPTGLCPRCAQLQRIPDHSSTLRRTLNRPGLLGDGEQGRGEPPRPSWRLRSLREWGMAGPSRFSPEVRDRAVRMVLKHENEHAA
jgi:ABC transporter substrate binding protein